MKSIFSLWLVAALLMGCNAANSDARSENVVRGNLRTLSAEDQKEIIHKEISTWEFAKQKDFESMKEIMREDYQAYFGKNILNLTETVSSFQNSFIEDYRMYNIKVKPVSDQTAIIYYNLRQHVTGSEGDKWIPEVASSTVYIKEDGVWHSVFYHETPMGD